VIGDPTIKRDSSGRINPAVAFLLLRTASFIDKQTLFFDRVFSPFPGISTLTLQVVSPTTVPL
jgi:hypothetical protein